MGSRDGASADLRVAGIEIFESKAFVQANQEKCRRAAAHALADRLLELGALVFDTSEEAWLGTDGYEPVGPPRCAMRATLILITASRGGRHKAKET
jgi:hypothetical protein